MAFGVMKDASGGQLNIAAVREAMVKDITFFDVGSETQMQLNFNSFCIKKCFECSELIEMKFYISKIKICGFRYTQPLAITR